MKIFLRGSLIFLMVLCGIAGIITVDVRSGHMAGYKPAFDMTVKNIEVDEDVTEGYAVGYELVFMVNNEAFAQKIQEYQNYLRLNF